MVLAVARDPHVRQQVGDLGRGLAELRVELEVGLREQLARAVLVEVHVGIGDDQVVELVAALALGDRAVAAGRDHVQPRRLAPVAEAAELVAGRQRRRRPRACERGQPRRIARERRERGARAERPLGAAVDEPVVDVQALLVVGRAQVGRREVAAQDEAARARGVARDRRHLARGRADDRAGLGAGQPADEAGRRRDQRAAGRLDDGPDRADAVEAGVHEAADRAGHDARGRADRLGDDAADGADDLGDACGRTGRSARR